MDENDRAIVGFVMVGHALVHVFELSIPIFMTVWLTEFSTTAAVLGGAVSVGYALFGVGALPGGLLVDRYGSRTLICAGMAGMGGAFVLLGLVPNVVGIVLALGVWGLAASVYHPAGLTLVSNGVHDRGKGFAYHGMAGNVGIAGGPLVTALLLLAFDWELVAWILAVPALVAAVLGLRIQFEPDAAVEDASAAGAARESSSLGSVLTDARRLLTAGFAVVLLIVAANGLYYRGVVTFLPDLLGDLVTAAVGDVRLGLFDPDSPVADRFDPAQYLYAGLLVVGIGGQYLGGALTDRIEPERGLVGMLSVLTVVAVAFVPVATTGLAGVVLVGAVLAFALFAVQPLSQATIAKYSVPESRGLSFGFTYLAIFGVGALGAAITGAVLTYATAGVLFLVLAGFSTVAGLLALSLVLKRPTRSKDGQHAG